MFAGLVLRLRDIPVHHAGAGSPHHLLVLWDVFLLRHQGEAVQRGDVQQRARDLEQGQLRQGGGH